MEGIKVWIHLQKEIILIHFYSQTSHAGLLHACCTGLGGSEQWSHYSVQLIDIE